MPDERLFDPAHSSSGPSTCSVIIRAGAQDAIDRHMSDDTAIEYGGVLVGTADPLIGLVIVTGYEPLPNSDSAETVTFTRETWDQMTRQVMSHYPGQRIVGWYHSHPRFGIFLSAHDLAIQTTYFSQPWQVAYVFDPVQHERGLFGWSNYEIVRIPEWEVATSTPGIVTTAPAHVPAHGEYITARLAEGAATAAAVSAPNAVQPAMSVSPSPPIDPAGAGVDRATQASGPRPGRAKWLALAVVVLVVGAVAAIIANRSGDDSSSSPNTVITTGPVAGGPETSVSGSTVTTTPTVTTESTTASTESAATSTSNGDSASTSSTDGVSATSAAGTPPTPVVVTSPGARVANGTLACEAASNGTFTPVGNCYVPLNNGNLVSFVNGSLTCADPSGTALAAATSFTVGVQGDPLAMLADGKLVAKCADLSYAKNVLAGGAATLDGLCGGSNTALDEASLRCIAQNPTTGAMAALVTGPNGSITGSCANGSAAPTVAALTWTKTGVDVSWRVVSLLYDTDTHTFTAAATRNGVPTTATFGCA